MKLLKAMATVAGLTGLSRVAGFARDMLTASIVGAGPLADAFFVALKLPNFFRRLTAEGAFSVSFVPLYSQTLGAEGREVADNFARNTFMVMLWALSAFTAFALIFMPLIVSLIAPGFGDDSDRYTLAVELTRVTFPYLLLMSLTSLLGGVMNAHDKFAPFAVAPVLFNLSIIAMLLARDFFETPGHAMAWGVFLAGILQFILLFLSARRIGFSLKLARPHLDARIKKLLRLMGPGVLGAGVVHINLFADMIIASFLATGSISYLYYADRLNQLPLSMVGIAVGTALLPMLSRALAAGNALESRRLFNRALEITLFLGIPSAVGLLMAAEPIIKVLFQHGAFTEKAAHHTTLILACYAIGLPAYVAVKVFSTVFWAQQDTLTPVKISIIVTLSNIALAIFLVQFIGVTGIALSTGLVAWLQLFLLGRKMGAYPCAHMDDRFRHALPRIIFASGLMAIVVFFVDAALKDFLAGPLLGQILVLCAVIGSGGLTYAATVFASGLFRMDDLRKLLKKGT